MFDISWGKLVLIGIVALIVIGPKELPAVLRTVGQWMGKIRRMAAEFQGQFQEAMREAEMADLKKQFDDTTSSVKSAFDTTDIKNEMEKLIGDPTGTTSPATTPPVSSDPASPPSDPAAYPGSASPTPPSAPTDPVAAMPAPTVDVPMPELPPPLDQSDFAGTTPTVSPAPSSTPASPEAHPAPADGGKAA
jgi:sec-independent protein translocase protein TatB